MAGNELDRLADYYDPYKQHTVPPPNAELPSFQPTSPVVNKPPALSYSDPYSTQQFIDAVKNSPLYKQEMENIARQQKSATDQMAFDSEWNKKFYELNRQQVAGSMPVDYTPSYGAGDAEARQLDALQKEVAARNLANQQEYSREALGSRGMGSSGQVALEQGELQYGFDTLSKEIDLRAQAREAQLAESRANAAAANAASRANAQLSISNQLADMDMRYQYDQAQTSRATQKLAEDIASANGDALFRVQDKLMPLYFDPQTGEYRGPGGEVMTVEQAQASTQQQQQAALPPPPAVDPPAVIQTPRDFLRL